MASERATSPSGQRVPDDVVYGCLHVNKVADSPKMAKTFESMVANNVIKPPGKTAYLLQDCHQCMKAAEVADHEGKSGAWLSVLLRPLEDQARARNPMSLMLMFNTLWCMLANDIPGPMRTDEVTYAFPMRDKKILAYDIFLVFRQWCRLVTKDLSGPEQDPDSLRRFYKVIGDVWGLLVFQDMRKNMKYYQRPVPHPVLDIEPQWAEIKGRYDLFQAQVHIFRGRALSSQTYPVDLSLEWKNLCFSASSWSAELLGPPQRSDLRLDILRREVAKSRVVTQDDVDRLLELIRTLHKKTMSFKFVLYQCFIFYNPCKEIKNWASAQALLKAVDALESFGAPLVPLEDEFRQRWPAYVEFARPFKDLLVGDGSHEEVLVMFMEN